MALSPSLHFSTPNFSLSSSATTNAAALSLPRLNRKIPINLSFSHRPITPRRVSVRGTENGSETSSEPEATTSTAAQETPADSGEVELSDVGKEIKKMLKERQIKEQEGGGDLLSGVVQEIREIEWPDFRKVLGTTGVVLGVIAGSSVVLLTVNAVLAELSDQVFAGKGIQDFFG